MTGAVWAAVSGIGFGLFQSINRRTLEQMDVYRSTFLLLLISTGVLIAITAVVEDLSVISNASAWALFNFAVAGLIHFYVGWTLLNASQKRIGAAKTSPLISTNPLFGTVIAAFTIQELPGVLTLIGLFVMMAGVYVVAADQQRESPRNAVEPAVIPPLEGEAPAEAPPRNRGGLVRVVRSRADVLTGSAFGLGTALAWAVSPILIVEGLKGLPSPLVGVSVSMVAAVAAYTISLVVRRQTRSGAKAQWGRGAWGWKAAAGVVVALATWFRWQALDHTSIAAVLALSLLAVPTVMVLAPIVAGRHLERVTPALWFGAALVVGGGLLIILTP
jgi:drug/metabolite transporter (DMT)-like permease